MNKLHILIVRDPGGDASDLAEMLREHPGWDAWEVQGVEPAIEAVMFQPPDVVVVSGTLEKEGKKKLMKVLESCDAAVPVFTETEGNAGDLALQIQAFLQERQRERLGAIRVFDTLDPGNFADDIRVVN